MKGTYTPTREGAIDCYEASASRERNSAFIPLWAWPDYSAGCEHYTDRKSSWKSYEIVRVRPRC